MDYLTSTTRWDNLKGKMLAEKEPSKQANLRRLGLTADYALSSIDAVTESGEFIQVDASGTRVGFAYAAGQMIYVVGTQKIVKDMNEAWERVRTYSWENESARVRLTSPGAKGSTIANAIINFSVPYQKGKFHFLFVEEPVGY